MSKLNYIQAGLHPSWIAVAGPDPHSRSAIASLSPGPLFALNLSYYFEKKPQNKNKTPQTKYQLKKPRKSGLILTIDLMTHIFFIYIYEILLFLVINEILNHNIWQICGKTGLVFYACPRLS